MASHISPGRLTITNSDLTGPDRQIDNPVRIRYNNSIWQGIVHYKESRQLNRQTEQAVFSYFQERYHIEDKGHFKRVWNEIASKTWNVKSPLTVGVLCSIDKQFQQRLAYYGDGVTSAPQLNDHPNPNVQQIIHALLHGGPLNTRELANIPLLRAVFIDKSPRFLKDFRDELQRELNQLSENPPKSEQEKIIWKGFLGNIIALLPFGYPEENESITLPMLGEDNTCQNVKYKINVLELTPRTESTPITALGLSPQDLPTAPPILTFLGTTYPAADGFAATILADFTPGKSVGEAVYATGKEKIDEWVKDKSNIHLAGMSLGGALAFHTLLHHQPKVSQVDVFNPPGLYENCWKGHKFDEGSSINIYNQSGDIVSSMGFWPTGARVSLYKVIPHHEGVKEGVGASHAMTFTGCNKVTVLKVKPEEDNNRLSRKTLTYLHRFLGPVLIYLPVKLMLCAHRIAKAAKECLSRICVGVSVGARRSWTWISDGFNSICRGISNVVHGRWPSNRKKRGEPEENSGTSS